MAWQGIQEEGQIKSEVSKAQKKWNLTVTKSMAMKTKQIALDEIQGTFREQYKRIYDYAHELMRTNPGFHSAALVLDFIIESFFLILATSECSTSISGFAQRKKLQPCCTCTYPPRSSTIPSPKRPKLEEKHNPKICDLGSPWSLRFTTLASHHGNKVTAYHVTKPCYETRLSFVQPWRSPSSRSSTVNSALQQWLPRCFTLSSFQFNMRTSMDMVNKINPEKEVWNLKVRLYLLCIIYEVPQDTMYCEAGSL
ncbi:hypothetical protein Ahy_B06g083791 [Arachis hypogaea]|uniref:Uncharacterized protein n=1 Tax=Arachis hypogaea TaxID=3818 RepID=A0A444YQE1_ARAHY|nr:hypothetical protein Ahy_B06g083791 [Arachis hypogaea]